MHAAVLLGVFSYFCNGSFENADVPFATIVNGFY